MELLTTEEAAALFRVSAVTFRRWVKTGRLEEYGIHIYPSPGGRLRFDREEILEALKSRRLVTKKAGEERG